MLTTRFAPSPTGYLHIGGARTALYCYLFAKNNAGKYILRIEDTDLERSTPESIKAILDSLDWLGLAYDDGPYYQTKRFDRYNELIEQLLNENKAYRCYCSKERLDNLRENLIANKQKAKYDGCCRNLSREEQDINKPHVIRFKNPTDGEVEFVDLVRAKITVANQELDDLIIKRTDGSPTYNFTVVVDDFDMKITHVIRGEDHIGNTPRQINIFKALGVDAPIYAHIPMILGEDGKRLSKRHGAVSVMQYRDDGYLKEALLNYLVRLGWSHGDEEIFSLEDMVAKFSLDKVQKSPAAFSVDKLNWLNQHYMKTLDSAYVAQAAKYHFEQAGIDLANGPDLKAVVEIQAERVKTLKEMCELSKYFYQDFDKIDDKAAKQHLRPVVLEPFKALLEQLKTINDNDWLAENLSQAVRIICEQLDLKMGKLAQPLRVAITGGSVSPSIDITLQLIGKSRVVARIEHAIILIEKRMAQSA